MYKRASTLPFSEQLHQCHALFASTDRQFRVIIVDIHHVRSALRNGACKLAVLNA